MNFISTQIKIYYHFASHWDKRETTAAVAVWYNQNNQEFFLLCGPMRNTEIQRLKVAFVNKLLHCTLPKTISQLLNYNSFSLTRCSM